MDEFPSIPDLFEFLENDNSWNEIGKSYLFIVELIAKCGAELFSKINLKYNIKRDIDDLRFYSGRYLLRSLRIFNSIVLLSIYQSIFEAEMLSRPLLDNIAETKYFLKSRRAKAIRKIQLYELINKKREYEATYAKDFERYTDQDGNVILSKYIFEQGELLRKEISEKLLNYCNDEIIKMEKYIGKNLSWHGLHPKELFKRLNMQDIDIERYYNACKLIHIREEIPLHVGNKKDFYAKSKILQISLLILDHANDFIAICPATFASLETKSSLENYYKNINITIEKECNQYDPKIMELVKLVPVIE
jgi:hypothetical protein